MRKVKVWGGEHPDELAPLACADSLEEDPIPNVSSGIENLLARRLGKRLVDINLANASVTPTRLITKNGERLRYYTKVKDTTPSVACIPLESLAKTWGP